MSPRQAPHLVQQGIHLLVLDLLPANARTPLGLARVIWQELAEEDVELPPDQPLVQASFDAGPPPVAYLEAIAVGDVLPELPLFLEPEVYVPAPLEETYQATWALFSNPLKGLLEPRRPGDRAES